MKNKMLVSIICNAYNHEPYIAQCLDGFIMQRTNFDFEVLVHDDASTDKTADIIRMYESQYPQIIKPIYQTENQYSKNGVSQFQYPRVQGKYVAFCEGDDYWTDPYKLQKQFDGMEAHPEVDICAHNAVMLNAKTNKKIRNIASRKWNMIIPVENVILGGGGFVATNSLFFRVELLNNMPPFRRMSELDYAMQIHGALRGGMLYLNDSMSVYRFQTTGSWSAAQQENTKKRQELNQELFQILQQLDIDTHMRYHVAIQERIRFIEAKTNCDWKEMLAKENRNCFSLRSRQEKSHIILKAYFPNLFKLWKCLRNRRISR